MEFSKKRKGGVISPCRGLREPMKGGGEGSWHYCILGNVPVFGRGDVKEMEAGNCECEFDPASEDLEVKERGEFPLLVPGGEREIGVST